MHDSYFIMYRVRQCSNTQSYEAIEHGHCRRFASYYRGKKGHRNSADTRKKISNSLIAMCDAIISMIFKMDSEEQHNIGPTSKQLGIINTVWHYIKIFYKDVF
jgi:hypothetical protein